MHELYDIFEPDDDDVIRMTMRELIELIIKLNPGPHIPVPTSSTTYRGEKVYGMYKGRYILLGK